MFELGLRIVAVGGTIDPMYYGDKGTVVLVYSDGSIRIRWDDIPEVAYKYYKPEESFELVSYKDNALTRILHPNQKRVKSSV